MYIAREQLIKELSKKSGYLQNDIRKLLHCFDEIITGHFSEVTNDEEVIVQLIKGIRCGCKVMPPRQRVDPRTYEQIEIGETIKPFCRFSEDFRKTIQEQYELKQDG